MKLAAVHAGDVVEITGPGGPRLAEVRAKHRGRLTVLPWRSAHARETAPESVGARDVLAHYPRRARPSGAIAGDLVDVDIRGRRFHALILERTERGQLRLQPITPHVNYFHARPRDLRTRWAARENRHEPTLRAAARPSRGGRADEHARPVRPVPADRGRSRAGASA